MARTRDIRTNQLDIACDVCGRTLLRGEHAEHYLAGGERRMVCDLCTARAQHEGWIRESGADDLELRHPRHERRARSSTACAPPPRARAATASHDELEAAEPRDAARGAGRPAGAAARAAPHPRRADERRAQDAARAGRLQRVRPHAHRRRRRPLARRARASACARAPTAPAVVAITVMWELSWYRFEVDLSDEAGGVRRDAQGDELVRADPGGAGGQRRGRRARRAPPRESTHDRVLSTAHKG